MSTALSLDLRVRVLAAVEGGASHREAAARSGASAASVSRWWRRRAWVEAQPDLDPARLVFIDGEARARHRFERRAERGRRPT